MRQQRIKAVHTVTPELRASERSVDAALVQVARFTATLLEAHRDSGLAATVGHDAVVEAASTFHTLVQARGQIVRTHLCLGEVKVQIGLGTYMGGNGGDKPNVTEPVALVTPDLRVVA